ncbi:MAG: AbrB/MazE/SpoVT family DNA-binding domain-containing protein [Thermodesulfobacteriota bacterium]|nr:AbrB/MazE/SpoVT family DNA-binding domain-containing protein [Thermodesulfobacteriota bacterium]
MHTKIQKWGNSQGLRLTKIMLEEIQATVGDEVEIYTHEGKIIIEPVKQIRGKYDLKSLIANIPQEYQPAEAEWGNPVGKEVW